MQHRQSVSALSCWICIQLKVVAAFGISVKSALGIVDGTNSLLYKVSAQI